MHSHGRKHGLRKKNKHFCLIERQQNNLGCKIKMHSHGRKHGLRKKKIKKCCIERQQNNLGSIKMSNKMC